LYTGIIIQGLLLFSVIIKWMHSVNQVSNSQIVKDRLRVNQGNNLEEKD